MGLTEKVPFLLEARMKELGCECVGLARTLYTAVTTYAHASYTLPCVMELVLAPTPTLAHPLNPNSNLHPALSPNP